MTRFAESDGLGDDALGFWFCKRSYHMKRIFISYETNVNPWREIHSRSHSRADCPSTGTGACECPSRPTASRCDEYAGQGGPIIVTEEVLKALQSGYRELMEGIQSGG